MDEFPVFTLDEANLMLPEVIRVTEDARARLAELDALWGKLSLRKFNPEVGATQDDIIRADWARTVATMGVQPKGFFVVDFQSPDPDTVYCWACGELIVSHQHKTWETFADRRQIEDSGSFLPEDSDPWREGESRVDE